MIIPLVDEKKRIHGVAMCWQLEKVISRKDRDTWEPFKWFTDFDKAMCVATANAVPAPHPAHTITSALNALAHALQARADEFVVSSGVTRSVTIQIDSKKRIRKTPICWQLEKRVSNKKRVSPGKATNGLEPAIRHCGKLRSLRSRCIQPPASQAPSRRSQRSEQITNHCLMRRRSQPGRSIGAGARFVHLWHPLRRARRA